MKKLGRWKRKPRSWAWFTSLGSEPVSEDEAPEPAHETQGRVELMRETSAALWIEERLWKWDKSGVHVGSLVPEGYAAYARILHPAGRRMEDGGGRVRWSTVASWTGRVVHPEMQFGRIANLAGPHELPTWGYPPQDGLLPRDEGERLAGLLRPFTSTPDLCWFGIWEGYGFLDGQRYSGIPRVRTPGRAYLLYRGPIQAATSFAWGPTWQSPNLWWPDDRAWCVATEIDLAETYVGGTDHCIDRIVADTELEALRTTVAARVDFEGDTINR